MKTFAVLAEPETDISTTRESENDLERRDYPLNQSKSMKKKLMATDIPSLKLTVTGGGVKMCLNAGMYELLKTSADAYFTSQDQLTCKKIQVTDKTGKNVETKYKVMSDKSGHYTVNLYHTRSSCLVNGKNSDQFFKSDLPCVFQLIEQKLADENCSIDDFNSNVRKMILQYFDQTPEMKESKNLLPLEEPNENQSYQCQTPADNEQIDSKNTNADIKISTETTETQIDGSFNSLNRADNSTQTSEDHVMGILRLVHTGINEMKDLLTSHIIFTNNKFSQINDEIVSIKRGATTHYSSTDRSLDDVSEKQIAIKSEVQKVHDNIQKRFQGIFHQLKALHEKNINDISSTKPIVIEDNDKITDTETEEINLQTTGNRSNHTSAQKTVKYHNEKQQSPRLDVSMNKNMSDIAKNKTNGNFPNKDRTLIIGDSIVKGIQQPGLDSLVDCIKLSGAIITDIARKLQNIDLRQYGNVIIFVGGNDVSGGKWPDASRVELTKVVQTLHRQRCKVYLCTVSPRQQVDVSLYNSYVRDICAETGARLIDCYQSFVYGDGSRVRHYFMADGVHLNGYGSRTLVATINRHISIIKRNEKASTLTKMNQSSYTVTSGEGRIKTGNENNAIHRDRRAINQTETMRPHVVQSGYESNVSGNSHNNNNFDNWYYHHRNMTPESRTFHGTMNSYNENGRKY